MNANGEDTRKTCTMLMDDPAEHHAHPLKLLRPEHPVVLIPAFTFTTVLLEVNKCYLDSPSGVHF